MRWRVGWGLDVNVGEVMSRLGWLVGARRGEEGKEGEGEGEEARRRTGSWAVVAGKIEDALFR